MTNVGTKSRSCTQCNNLFGFNHETLINQMKGYDLIVTSQKVWIFHIEWVDYKGAH
jgi:hypothetical protein